MDKNILIDAIIKTLDTIPVAGFENSQKMIGVFNALQQIKEGEENVDLPKSE